MSYIKYLILSFILSFILYKVSLSSRKYLMFYVIFVIYKISNLILSFIFYVIFVLCVLHAVFLPCVFSWFFCYFIIRNHYRFYGKRKFIALYPFITLSLFLFTPFSLSLPIQPIYLSSFIVFSLSPSSIEIRADEKVIKKEFISPRRICFFFLSFWGF